MVVTLLMTLGSLFPVALAQNSSNPFDDMLSQADAMRSANPVKFKALLEDIPFSQLSRDQKLLFRYLDAYRKSISGNFDAAIEDHLILQDDASGDLKYRSMASLVNLYALKAEWRLGLNAAAALVEGLKNVESKLVQEQALASIVIFYNQIEDFESATFYADTLIKTSPSPRFVCTAKGQLAEAKLRSGRVEGLEELIFEVIRLCDEIGEPIMRELAISFLSELYMADGDYEAALTNLLNHLDSVESFQYPNAISLYYSLIAKAQRNLGDTQNAAQNAAKAISAQPISGYQPALVSAFQTLYLIAEQNRDFQQALVYHKSYSDALTNQADVIKTKALLVEQARLTTLEKSNRILLLDKENALLQTEASLAHERAQNVQLALALSFSLIIVLILWVYRSRKLQVKLREIAQTDELTGAANRHYFTLESDRLINKCEHDNLPISMILFDLDHFKRVNDQFGHLVGDWALKKAVNAVVAVGRANDITGRMGGEEFAILLPGCNLTKARELAELCRKKIESIDCSEQSDDMVLTASFGVSDAATCGFDFDAMFAGADKALYLSKNAGRNKVFQYQLEHLALNV